MGWDAFAQNADGSKFMRWIASEYRFEEQPLFAVGASIVAKNFGTCDGLLAYGGLDVSRCGEMLERATGADCWGEDWSAERVRELAASARWEFEVDYRDLWAKGSARVFLDACARLGLSIHFSW